MLFGRLTPPKRLYALLSLAIVPILLWICLCRPSSECLNITFIDVGQGDSAVIRTPTGRTILIDGGGRPGDPYSDAIGPKVVEPVLRSYGISRIDMMVLSHPHDDHLKGLLTVLRDFKVDRVLDPGIPHPSICYQEFLSIIDERHIEYHRALRGQKIDFGDGVTAEVLHPRLPLMEGTRDDTNNNSIVLRFSYDHWKVLFTGDASEAAEADILSARLNPHSDVLKVGHHGSATATSDEWLDAVRPRVAVISVGRRNTFGHPAPSTLRRLDQHGVKVFRTDRNGAVSIRLCKGSDRITIVTNR
jgi:competence protein ComEC